MSTIFIKEKILLLKMIDTSLNIYYNLINKRKYED